jgi:O-acetylserine/cysteine efflux transporter
LAAFPAVLILNREGIGWRWILSIGLVLGVVMYSLLFVGMKSGMPAGLSSLVLQIQVVFTLLLSAMVLQDAPSGWQKFGVAVALAGMGLLGASMRATPSFVGLVLVVSAGFAWAASNILIKLAGEVDMLRLIVWMSAVPPLPMLLVSLIFEQGQMESLLAMSWIGAGTVVYTGLIATVLGFAIWGQLFKENSPNVVAPFSLLVPIFGIISSVLVLHEEFTWIELTSICLVFAGLLLVVFGSRLMALLGGTSGSATGTGSATG